MRIRYSRRHAAAVVEAALVLPIALLLLLAVAEFCRFIFFLQVAENAAREGARFAVVRTGDGTTAADVINYVTDKLAGRQHELAGLSISVTNVDPNTGTPVAGTNWNDAPFGGAIQVQIRGNYSPLLASFLNLPVSFAVQVTAMMSSEAN